MLKRNQPALQVKLDGQWEYVFCYLVNKADPVITKDRRKALSAKRDLEYFKGKFGNHEFRAHKEE